MRSRIIHSLRPLFHTRPVTTWKTAATNTTTEWLPLTHTTGLAPGPHPPIFGKAEIIRRKEVQVRNLFEAEGEDVVEEIMSARSAIWDGVNGGEFVLPSLAQ